MAVASTTLLYYSLSVINYIVMPARSNDSLAAAGRSGLLHRDSGMISASAIESNFELGVTGTQAALPLTGTQLEALFHWHYEL